MGKNIVLRPVVMGMDAVIRDAEDGDVTLSEVEKVTIHFKIGGGTEIIMIVYKDMSVEVINGEAIETK